MKQTILIPAMFIASCASAPEVKKTELGDLKCRAEIGVYDEADGKGAAACASSEFMK